MTGKAHRIRRIATGIALATTLAALVAPSALARATTHQGAPDGWVGSIPSSTAMIDGRSPDTLDAAIAAAIANHQASPVPTDGRSPDTIDAALNAHYPVTTVATPYRIRLARLRDRLRGCGRRHAAACRVPVERAVVAQAQRRRA